MPFLNEMTLHVSMLLVPYVDAGVSVELGSARIGIELEVEEIFPTWFSKFFMLIP